MPMVVTRYTWYGIEVSILPYFSADSCYMVTCPQVNFHRYRIHMQLWDTSGDPRFSCLTASLYRDSMAFLLMWVYLSEFIFMYVNLSCVCKNSWLVSGILLSLQDYVSRFADRLATCTCHSCPRDAVHYKIIKMWIFAHRLINSPVTDPQNFRYHYPNQIIKPQPTFWLTVNL